MSARRQTVEEARRVVITVHGMRTHARWQKTVTPVLNLSKMTVVPFEYGWFNLIKFASARSRNKVIEQFREFYQQIVTTAGYGLNPEDPGLRPSVVAHSLGTYIIGKCMRKYPYVRFDKIILCGSILPTNFNWSEVFARDQANYVRNIRCMRDPWVPKARWLVTDGGSSGVDGFDYWGTLLEEKRREDCSHSDFFTEADVREDWLPLLNKPPSRFRVVHSRSIESDDELEAMLNQTHEIDTKVFAQCDHYGEQELPRGVSTGWTNVNRDIYTFLVHRRTKRPVGYVNAMPVTTECFNKIISGDVQDNQILADDVAPYLPDSSPCLYLMSIAIDPEHRNGLDSEGVERLVNAVVGKLVYYTTQRRVKVHRIAAVGWTAVGKKLCGILGMKAVTKDRFGNDVFHVDLEDHLKSGEAPKHLGVRQLERLA